MDTRPEGDLNDLERRLSALAPAADGLNTDAMLFAAGRAAVRPGPGRFIWPTIAGCLTAALIAVGGWGLSERSARLALAQQLQTQPAPPPLPDPAPPYEPPPPLELSPYSYLSALRALERGETWPPEPSPEPPGPPTPPPPTLRSWPLDLYIDS
jgi:hypothetical protein